jgi:hypothetical protein
MRKFEMDVLTLADLGLKDVPQPDPQIPREKHPEGHAMNENFTRELVGRIIDRVKRI